MGFYGNVTNVSKNSMFTFDKTYHNRAEMEANSEADGIYIGRYVLVDYDSKYTDSDFVEVQGIKKVDSNTTANLNGLYGLKVTAQGDSAQVYLGTDLETGSVRKLNISNFPEEERPSGLTEKTWIYFVCVGQDTITEVEEEDDEETEVSYDVAAFRIITSSESDFNTLGTTTYYVTNYNIDQDAFGDEEGNVTAGRGWDSTVWQKVYSDGNEKYVMIAELNSVVPTFDISSDAPTMMPISPHFAEESTSTYYKLHIQPQWGFRVKAAKPLKGPVITYNGSEKEDGSTTLLTEDETLSYLSDSKVQWVRSEYNSLTNRDDTTYFAFKTLTDLDDNTTTLSEDEGEWITDPTQASSLDAAIYWNKAGFDKTTISYINNLDDDIRIEASGLSGHEYEGHQGEYLLGSKLPRVDTQELSIMLPSIGNAVSDLWDTIYGDKTINNGLERNLDMDWDSTEGIRMVEPASDGYHYDWETTNAKCIAGVVNSVHDLMGMIVDNRDIKTQAQIDAADPTRIYYGDCNPETSSPAAFYRKMELDKLTHVPASYKVADPQPTEETFVTGVYFIKDGDTYTVQSSFNKNKTYYVKYLEGVNYNSVKLLNWPSPNTEYFYQDNNRQFIIEKGKCDYNKQYCTVTPTVKLISADYNPNTFWYKTQTSNNQIYYKKDFNEVPQGNINYYKFKSGIALQINGDQEATYYTSNTYYRVKKKDDGTDDVKEWGLLSEEDWDPDVYFYWNGDHYELSRGLTDEDGNIQRDTQGRAKYDSSITNYCTPNWEKLGSVANPVYIMPTNEEDGTPIDLYYLDYTTTVTSDEVVQYAVADPQPTADTFASKEYYEQLPTGKYKAVTEYDSSKTYYVENGTTIEYRDSTTVINSCKYYPSGTLLQYKPNTYYYRKAYRPTEDVEYDATHIYYVKNSTTGEFNTISLNEETFAEKMYEDNITLYEYIVDNLFYEDAPDDGDYYLSTGNNSEPEVTITNGKTSFTYPIYYSLYKISSENAEDNAAWTIAKDEQNEPIPFSETDTTDSSVFYHPNTFYYKTDEGDYKIDKTKKKTQGRTYYTIADEDIKTADADGNEYKFYQSNKYYYQNYQGEYIIDDSLSLTEGRSYYLMIPYYVFSDSKGVFSQGSKWNMNVTNIPASIEMATLTKQNVMSELPGFARTLNTIHGLILQINKILKTDDPYTRDMDTVQGCINKINDLINAISGLNPGDIPIVDCYGRINGAAHTTEQVQTWKNYGNNAEGTASGDNEDRFVRLVVNTDADNPTITIEHNFTAVDDTTTSADKNTDNDAKDGLNNGYGDTIDLYTPIVDNMGHVVGKNTETVTLPYGFKTITTNGRESDNNTTELADQEDVVADNTQDTLAINSGNEWIKIETDDSEGKITISHDVKTVEIKDSNANLSSEESKVITFDVPTYSFDSTNHYSGHNTKTLTMPSSYGIVKGDSGTSEASATHDTFTISTGDDWLTTTVTKDALSITHDYPGDHNDTTGTDNINNNGDTIDLETVVLDDKGHVSHVHTNTVTLPYGYKTFKDSESTQGSSVANSTQDTFVFKGDDWIKPTVSNDLLIIGHIGPVSVDARNLPNVEPKFGDTFSIEDWEFDSKGHKSTVSTHTVKIPQGSLSDNDPNGADVITKLSFDAADGKLSSTRTNIGNLKLADYSYLASDTSEIVAADTLNAALSKVQANLNVLKGGATIEGSVAYQIAQIVNENNNGSIDTLNEIAAWIVSDSTGAAKMKSDIATNAQDIDSLEALVGTTAVSTQISTAIEDLDVSSISVGAANTISTIFETDGKISAETTPISIKSSQVNDSVAEITSSSALAQSSAVKTYVDNAITNMVPTTTIFTSDDDPELNGKTLIEIITDLKARIATLETKVEALENANS